MLTYSKLKHLVELQLSQNIHTVKITDENFNTCIKVLNSIPNITYNITKEGGVNTFQLFSQPWLRKNTHYHFKNLL